ncbi:hypothetical protein CH275_10270 [Rhodococcus sp. 06-235-1A]|uniref:alpha/beta fold hydrolase n=1 Tax=Rhodococcus sp. 06-235-1A TaxID=2022508 RepID=UPI000B9A2B22|nr:alpha/beta fold hydrolase [Rhodococcus sp. 06-235-1A]OZD06585.1 hypothetical protein CH275_10270 [Rhodococcus sp. 06-235-1A]
MTTPSDVSKASNPKPHSHDDADARFAPTEQHCTVAGYSTRFLTAGSRHSVPVVLLHDGAWGGCSSVTWGPSIPTLARTHYVIAPDMLGFGGTDKTVFFDRNPYDFRIEHLIQFLDAVGIEEPVHVIGNSFGGSVALRMLATYATSQRIRSVVSVAGTGGPWRTPLAMSNLGHWDGTEKDLQRIVALLVGTGPAAERHLGDRLRWASEPGHYRALASPGLEIPAPLQQPRPADLWPVHLSGCMTPVLLVAGTDDLLLDPGWTEHLERVLENCTTEWMDCLHSPNISHPKDLSAVITSFLTGIDHHDHPTAARNAFPTEPKNRADPSQTRT